MIPRLALFQSRWRQRPARVGRKHSPAMLPRRQSRWGCTFTSSVRLGRQWPHPLHLGGVQWGGLPYVAIEVRWARLGGADYHTWQYLMHLFMPAGRATQTLRGLAQGFNFLQLNASIHADLGLEPLEGVIVPGSVGSSTMEAVVLALGGLRSPQLGLGLRHGVTSAESEWILPALATTLPITYVVQYQALDRKLRKIVKNRYRYVRRYVCLRPSERLRVGLRLVRAAYPLYTNRVWAVRVAEVIRSILYRTPSSLVLRMHERHQWVALQALGLR